MSKIVALTIAGASINALVNMATLREVNDKVGCPITMLGKPTGTEAPITQLAALTAAAIAMRSAGDKRSLTLLQEHLFPMDPSQYYGAACRYLVSFFSDADGKASVAEGSGDEATGD